ncbi:DUF397 domain-containing protein [Streptomyces sp. 8K308]|uniref:DUF397 domain-containing protein n=1 Tax=Streptomyces sp. 8K308 TaxID=2530388 RepID=UPI001053663E|nr:DUF397 domain-containing protein [Streptomyces sp. 8K308]TDC09301.1 DUF397 domain-containing protein [Streptomyces sp. 8K308]
MSTTHVMPQWRRSSYSNQNGGDCVEVADVISGVLPVRDSKDPADAVVTFGPAAWNAFLRDMRESRAR